VIAVKNKLKQGGRDRACPVSTLKNPKPFSFSHFYLHPENFLQ
jgi:hypothetical protein